MEITIRGGIKTKDGNFHFFTPFLSQPSGAEFDEKILIFALSVRHI